MGRKLKVHFPPKSFIFYDQHLLLVEEETSLEKIDDLVLLLQQMP